MTQRKVPWTFDEVCVNFVAKAANYIAGRYASFVEREDVHQEILVWALANRVRIERWLSSTPQQTTRIYRSMLDEGIDYAEKEKAAKVGYRVDDVTWYTPGQVEELIQPALDADYVRPKGKVDDQLAAVIDVRRAMTDDLRLYFLENEEGHEDWAARIQQIVTRLNGGIPYRRAMSNAQAQAITKTQTEG